MLVNGVVYRDGQRLADIGIDEVDQWMARPGCFVWLALRDATDDERAHLQRAFQLHDRAVEDARHGHQRPKFEACGDTLFAVMKLPGWQRGDFAVGELAIFVGQNFGLSVRSRSEQGLLGVRERCAREPEHLRAGAGFVPYALIDAVVDRCFPLLDAMESDLAQIETQSFERGAARWNVQRLYALKRQVAALRHVVAPTLEATTKRLAAWAAIFAVSTAMAGIWGMNFEHLPELRWAWGHPMALGLIATAGGLLCWRFRRAGGL